MLRTLKTPKPVWKQVLYARRYPDRAAARMAVNEAVKAGTLVNAKTLLCVDCLTPAREYDHHKGYAKEFWFHVDAVCRSCHLEREKRRRPLCHRGHRYTERDWAFGSLTFIAGQIVGKSEVTLLFLMAAWAWRSRALSLRRSS